MLQTPVASEKGTGYFGGGTLAAADAQALRHKMSAFQAVTHTRKYLMLTLLTTIGLKHNSHSIGLVEKVLTLDDLFG